MKKTIILFYSGVVKKISSHMLFGCHLYLEVVTGQTAVHLPVDMLYSVAKCANRARIPTPASIDKVVTCCRWM
jgi:hypothetical protein